MERFSLDFFFFNKFLLLDFVYLAYATMKIDQGMKQKKRTTIFREGRMIWNVINFSDFCIPFILFLYLIYHFRVRTNEKNVTERHTIVTLFCIFYTIFIYFLIKLIFIPQVYFLYIFHTSVMPKVKYTYFFIPKVYLIYTYRCRGDNFPRFCWCTFYIFFS